MPRSYISHLEESLGEKLTRRFVEQIDLNHQTLQSILDAIIKSPGHPEPLAGARTAVCPLISESRWRCGTTSLEVDFPIGDHTGTRRMRTANYSTESMLRQIKQCLLTSDCVYVSDLLFVHTTYAIRALQDETNLFHGSESHERSVREILHAYSTMRPLLVDECILPVRYYDEHADDSDAIDAEQALFGDESLETYFAYIPRHKRKWMPTFEVARRRMLRHALLREDLGGVFDLLALTQEEKEALDAIVDAVAMKLTRRKNESVVSAFTVATTQIADIAKVSWEEMAELRRNEEVFHQWRALVRRGIALVAGSDELNKVAIDELKDELFDGFTTWRRESQNLFRSNYWRQAKDSGVTAAVSAISGAASGLMLDAVSGVGPLSALIGGLLGCGRSQIAAAKERRASQALKSHALVFLDAEDVESIWVP